MKSGFLFLLAGLFALSLVPLQSAANPASNKTQVVNYPVELNYDDGVPAPQRDDPGPDWIFYDNDQPTSLWPLVNYWSRVRFTPNSEFRLIGVRFKPLNQGPNTDDECRVRVYSEDQDSHDLDDMLWEGVIDELQGPDLTWEWIEIDEDDQPVFDGREHFSILYGPAPGGNYDPNNMQDGDGWWNLLDGATEVNRSYHTQSNQNQPPTRHRDWIQDDGDLLIRANGEYIADFIDVGIECVYNDTETWLMYSETEQRPIANLYYEGQPAGFVVISFNVFDSEGNSYWEDPVEQILEDPFDGMEPGDILEVECESVWIPEATGYYEIIVNLIVQDDANEENDYMSMEQIVFDPRAEELMDIGYCGDQPTGASNGQDSTGWTTSFGHPGGVDQLWITSFSQYFEGGNQAVDAQFGILIFDVQAGGGQWVWQGTAEVPANYNGWIDVELNEEEIEATSYGEGYELWVMYLNSGLPIQIDGNPPVAGTNTNMPIAMYSNEGWSRYGPANTGDFMCRAKLGISNVAPPGHYLRIEPDPVEFGCNLELDTEYAIDAIFTSYGDEPVTIDTIIIADAGVDYLTCDHQEPFVIDAQTEITVRVTFQTSEDIDLETRMRVINDSENMSRLYTWDVHASTYPAAVDDDLTGVPAEYALFQNHPNPFNPTTSVGFALKTAGNVELNVYDMSGRMVREVVNGRLSAGYHNAQIDASDLPAGIYLYRLNAGNFTDTQKMILLK